MAGGLLNALLGKIEADGQIGERADAQGDWIAEDHCAGGNRNLSFSAEGEDVVRARLNRALVRAWGQMRAGNHEHGLTELVGELHADRVSAERDVDDVAI